MIGTAHTPSPRPSVGGSACWAAMGRKRGFTLASRGGTHSDVSRGGHGHG